jgi:aldose 1-epimerase
VELFTLRDGQGLEVSITNYGGIVTSLRVPDGADVALGFASLDSYLGEHPYMGALIGRYGNRIAKGRFQLNGKTCSLFLNNGPNSLHGGKQGFDRKLWKAGVQGNTLRLSLLSPDGEEGYPGNLSVTVDYSLTGDGGLSISYDATSDQDTVINLTNHTYFHLGGEGSGPVLDHEVTIEADQYTPVDATLIPTGEIASVEGTPFDFRTPHAIGERIEAPHEQIKRGGGYDHNFVLRGPAGQLRPAARVVHPGSGRAMEVLTTEPGLQFYTGNFLDGTLTGKAGRPYGRRHGFCMETQHFPDSPNQPAFPSTVLKAGQRYTSRTIYRFSRKG